MVFAVLVLGQKGVQSSSFGDVSFFLLLRLPAPVRWLCCSIENNAVRKKLKQISELESKKDKGESLGQNIFVGQTAEPVPH